MANHIVLGTFNAESSWDSGQTARLSPVDSAPEDPAVAGMDQLLVAVCRPDDVLLTRQEIHVDLATYHDSVGLACRRKSFNWTANTPEFWRPQWLNPALQHGATIRPYAVNRPVSELFTRLGVAQALPSLEAVRKVNSKAWSFELRERLGNSVPSRMTRGVQEFLAAGEQLLQSGPFVVKEEFGVAGSGNMLISTVARLRRMGDLLARQEAAGLTTVLILEAYCDKLFDYAYHLEVLEDGGYRFLGYQGVQNNGFSYQASVSLSGDQVARVERLTPQYFLPSVASALFAEGYFGPVCIDAMALRNDTLFPMVEINARMSMGYLNHHLEQRGAELGLGSYMGFLRVGTENPKPMRDILGYLQAEHLLFQPRKLGGIVPLASATFPTQQRESWAGAAGAVGKFFYWMPFRDSAEIARTAGALRELLARHQYKVLN